MSAEPTIPRPFADKLLALYEVFKYAKKDGTNEHFHYRFLQESEIKRRLNQAMRVLRLGLTSMEVKPIGEPTGKLAVVHVRLVISDLDDPTKDIVLEGIGAGMDSSDKAPTKAFVSAWKYAFMNGLSIPTGDDPESQPGEEAAIQDLLARVASATSVADLQPLKAEAAPLAEGNKATRKRLAAAFKARVEQLTGPKPGPAEEGNGK